LERFSPVIFTSNNFNPKKKEIKLKLFSYSNHSLKHTTELEGIETGNWRSHNLFGIFPSANTTRLKSRIFFVIRRRLLFAKNTRKKTFFFPIVGCCCQVNKVLCIFSFHPPCTHTQLRSPSHTFKGSHS
jgi:hypothetical protein